MKTSICGNGVEGDLLGEFLARDRLVVVDGAGLLEQLVHGVLARVRDGLIGRDHDALDRRQIMQRLERHDHLDGRAVGIGDDVALAKVGDGMRVDLGHDQRHLGIHAEL